MSARHPQVGCGIYLDPETREQVRATPRCLCSHARSQHTRGEGQCWSPVCGCTTFREKDQ